MAPGANFALKASDLPELDGITHLLLQLEIPLDAVTSYARAAKAKGVKVVLNAAPAQVLSPDLLSLVDVLVVNEGELALVSQHAGNIAACLARLAVPTIVVTLGQHGCCARTHGTFVWQPAFQVTPLDTTGAGDTFCGVLVAALSQGDVLPDAIRGASAAGALACTRLGAQSSIPTHTELTDFLGRQAQATESQQDTLKQFCGFSA